MLRFRGRSAVVTGAASGIGAACTHLLIGEGAARMVLVDRDTRNLDTAALPEDTLVVTGDVADTATWEAADLDGAPLDFAVVNAGVSASANVTDMAFSEWRRVLSANLDGAFLSLQFAMRNMPYGGSIVLVSSASAIKAEPGTAAYAASKAGIIQMAKVAAKEGAPRGIRVNVIAPGGVDTPIWDNASFFEDMIAQRGSREEAISAMGAMATPLGRFASTNEVAAQIAFLLSDAASTITGSVLLSDGGYSL